MSVGTFSQTYYSGEINHDIPGNARDILLQMAGGAGGNGSSGGTGGNSHRATFSIPGNFVGVSRNLKLYPGKKGSNGGIPQGGTSGGTFYGGAGGSGYYVVSYRCDYAANICTCPVAPGYSCTDSPPCSGGYTSASGCAEGGMRWFCPRTCYTGTNGYGGGAGGGASVAYLNNTLAVVLGGGGGGGGYSSAGNGANTSALSGVTSISGVAVGTAGSGRGSAGGEGGGGASAGTTSKVWTQSSLSRYNSNLVSISTDYGAYNSTAFIQLSYTTVTPEITSFVSNRSTIKLGGYENTPSSFTFSFDAIDYLSLELTGPFGNGGSMQTITFVPGDTLQYTWTPVQAYSNGVNITLKAITGSATDTSVLNVIVYQPPTVNVTADNSSILLGGNTTIRWNSSGDCDTLVWTSGGITNVGLNSSQVVSPTVSTDYSAYVEGLGGTSSLSTARVTVYQQPSITSFTVPSQLNYGQEQFNVEYDTLYANVSLTLQIYNGGYTNGPNEGTTFLHETINLTTAQSAEAGETTLGRAQAIIAVNPQWDNFGPRTITVRLTGTGDGGSFVDEESIQILIDETPENLNIPERDDILKDQDPVIVPDTDILSETLLIDDIDIPVEIKSDWPILVDKNLDGTWTKVRQI